jgi:hypothetical protein
MEQNFSSEANLSQASQNIPRALWNTKVYFRFQNPAFCP